MASNFGCWDSVFRRSPGHKLAMNWHHFFSCFVCFVSRHGPNNNSPGLTRPGIKAAQHENAFKLTLTSVIIWGIK